MIPRNGSHAVYHDDERRFAVGVSSPRSGMLCFTVGDTTGHPFGASPIAVLDKAAVARLRDDLTDWLEKR